MKHTGRCYCGDLHFEFSGTVHSQILCHCRECRYLSGGAANTSVVIAEDSFQWTKGVPSIFERRDLDAPRTRYFCGICGTHICVKSPPRPGKLVLKIGTLDDHSWFKPETAIFCVDKQPFHIIPTDLPSYEKVP